MSNWSEGYVSGLDYNYGYYPALNPSSHIIPLLMSGLAAPTVEHACELGFGQGITINIHAAAGNAQWHGTDFNPAHTAFARHLADIAGTEAHKLRLSEQSFQEYCARDDLPDFDYIALHGIWSWISDDNRHIIVDFLRRKLKPGGILYISYNTLPGWSTNAPIRHLLAEYDKEMGDRAHSPQDNILAAIRFGEHILSHSPGLQRRAPRMAESLHNLLTQDPAYLIHEYLNQNWQPMYFSQTQALLQDAKMDYACSARTMENFLPCLFDDSQIAFFESIASPSFAETVKDYMINQQFRCDYWVKGKRPLNPLELEKAWQQLRIILLVDRKDYSPAMNFIQNIDIRPDMVDPILDQLQDGRIHSVADLQKTLATSFDSERLFLGLSLLYTKGDIALCASDENIAARRESCHRLNRHIIEQAAVSNTLNYLASPVTGGGIAVNHVSNLFLLAHLQNRPAEDWPAYAWAALNAQNRTLLKDGQRLESEADNLAELRTRHSTFLQKELPLLEKLQCLPK